ncbi:hypothetical protein CHK_1620 [Christensenella hongkongensis]|uniref:Uncharacterized protein n=1 Tax=Christensenella hongkongensis TaxID=270498 RepID=A0A0M2NIU8_9FIRM|nr:hypothetical protein CHK_1620 [Christensenella hongkongensis]
MSRSHELLPPSWLSGRFFARVPTERTCGCELAEFMSDHVFCNIDRNEFSAVMNADCVSYHIREDRGGTRPCFQHFLFVLFIHLLNARQKLFIYKWSLFY